MYKKIPNEIKPKTTISIVNYATTFKLDFLVMLRERKLTTLTNMQTEIVEIEGNLTATRKLRRTNTRDENYGIEKDKENGKDKDKNKLKDEPNHTTHNKDITK